MHHPPLTHEAGFLRERPSVPCRVAFQTVSATTSSEQTGRLDALWATGCPIQTPLHLDASVTVELHLDLPDGSRPLRIDHARIIWTQEIEWT